MAARTTGTCSCPSPPSRGFDPGQRASSSTLAHTLACRCPLRWTAALGASRWRTTQALPREVGRVRGEPYGPPRARRCRNPTATPCPCPRGPCPAAGSGRFPAGPQPGPELRSGAPALVGAWVLYRWPLEGWVAGRVRRVCRWGGFSHVVGYASASSSLGAASGTCFKAACAVGTAGLPCPVWACARPARDRNGHGPQAAAPGPGPVTTMPGGLVPGMFKLAEMPQNYDTFPMDSEAIKAFKLAEHATGNSHH